MIVLVPCPRHRDHGSVLNASALFIYSAAMGIMAHGVETREALAAAVVSGLAAFSIFFDSGTYAPGGSVMPFVGLVAGGIFVASASVFMGREHLPEVAPLAMPQA